MHGTINGRPVEFKANETILTVARRNGQFIPTLCEMEDIHHAPATCRVCLVEIVRKDATEGHLVTACNTPMEEGLAVLTRNQRVREAQRLQVELLLADHNQDCATCIRHGSCELQDVAQFVGLTQARYHYPHFYAKRTLDDSSPAIVRDMSKCIRCLRCLTVCREVQGVDVLVVGSSGLTAEVRTRDDQPVDVSDCVCCGQCTLVCPVGALAERDDIEQVIDYLYDTNVTTVFQMAPSIRVALGEEFGLKPGANVQGQAVAALKKLGADVVLDTNFAADLVIMEEGTELLSKIKDGGPFPMFTSCCPGWINFVEKHYPQIAPHLSTTQSPQQCFGAVAKTYLARKMGLDPKRMRVVSIMPCTAKKGEAKRPEFSIEGYPTVDAVLTTREFARLLKREGIDLAELKPLPYDNPWMGDFTGAGAIFGSTGGVMEAALRTVYKVVTGNELAGIEIKAVRGLTDVREAAIDLPGVGEVRVAVAHGLAGARHMVEEVLAGRSKHHFIEVMACPGGCMCGGGQPQGKKAYQEHRKARQKALYAIDKACAVRQSHNNPHIQLLYRDFLGAPNSHEAHELLHTHYHDRKQTVTHTMQEIWREIKTRNRVV
jgi:ferredoxin hydrogenase gamma subunit